MPSLQVETAGAAVFVTLRRPPRNVLDVAAIRELGSQLALVQDRRDLKTAVLRSGLPGVFSAGVDVADHSAERVPETLAAFHEVFRILDRLPQVTVAAVDGICLGGGCELASFCDILLATPRSSFGQPEIDLGCFPPVAAAVLPRLVGRAAFELVLTGRRLSAEEARQAGLVTRVVDDLQAEVDRWVSILESKSGVALAAARRALRASTRPGFEQALRDAERLYLEDVAPSADAEEGVRAFVAKRAPRWSNS
jgi:cyclohexa-1,5-dienecarbonyl-CoA hydratase